MLFLFPLWGIIGNDGGGQFASGGALRDFDFLDQLIGDGIQMASGGVLGLLHKIDGAEREGFESGIPALFRMGAEKNDRHRSAAHDQTERFHAVHARHFEVEGDDIGMQLFDFFQSESAVHGGADDFDGRVAGKDRRNEFPHEGGIVDDENSDAGAHAMAPSGTARERRERTAGTFRMRTTVPSPSMEAPLTRSLVTMSVGKALMTSSSSPTMLSTTRPNRFSAAPITMTKCFFFCGSVSIARRRLRCSRRTSVRIWSRRRRTSRWSTRWISCSWIREISTTDDSGTANRRPPTRKSSV